jgi:hypothetical protein
MLDANGNPNPSRAQLYALRKAHVNGSSDWNQSESSGKAERIMARSVVFSTDEFGHEGTFRGDVK